MYLIWRMNTTAKAAKKNTSPNVIHLQYALNAFIYVVDDRKRRAVAKKKEHSEATEVFCCNDKFVILFTDNFLNMKMLLGEGFSIWNAF